MSTVLLETVATAKRGEPVYYSCYTDPGPACTIDFKHAMVFKSHDMARLDRAYGFSLTNFEPYDADELAIWDALTCPDLDDMDLLELDAREIE